MSIAKEREKDRKGERLKKTNGRRREGQGKRKVEEEERTTGRRSLRLCFI